MDMSHDCNAEALATRQVHDPVANPVPSPVPNPELGLARSAAFREPDVMIQLDRVTMFYPLPRRYRDVLLRPLQSKRHTALSDVSLIVPRGASLAVLGSNGAGKTTLLKLMAGLLYPASGRVRVDGGDTTADNLAVRRTVSFVINEERSFYWRLTGRQNLRFFGTLDEVAPRLLDDRIARLLDLVGLASAADRQVGGYSSGMRQRLALARGLLTEPEVLILDEPTRAVDPISARQLRDLLLPTLHREHDKTLVIATHQLEEAEQLCDHVCVLHRGELLSCEPTAAALSRSGDLSRHLQATLAGAPLWHHRSSPELSASRTTP
jgi:ABC-2 type transport system ATP-binding protein